MLGAKAIHRLAGEAEAACAAGQAKRAVRLALQLVGKLQGLRQSAACALVAAAPAQAEDRTTLTGSQELEPQAMADFLDLLHQQSMAAIDRFSQLSPQLQQLLSKDSFELVREHIDNLQFSDAAKTLEAQL